MKYYSLLSLFRAARSRSNDNDASGLRARRRALPRSGDLGTNAGLHRAGSINGLHGWLQAQYALEHVGPAGSADSQFRRQIE